VLLFGWRYEGPTHKDIDKLVLIASPHTSNWDLVWMMAFAWTEDFQLRWFGKQQLFRFPFGGLMRMMGGQPIDRSRNSNVVEATAKAIKDHPGKLMVAIPAAGTRSRRDYWKSGFYFIASLAEVPISLGYLDYSRKRGSIGKLLYPSGDVTADMDVIRDWYKDKAGKHPQNVSRIRLRQEDDPDLVPATGSPGTDAPAPDVRSS
jgi:1-acyl-sn-glycerol-3-phosphate acyltransferase